MPPAKWERCGINRKDAFGRLFYYIYIHDQRVVVCPKAASPAIPTLCPAQIAKSNEKLPVCKRKLLDKEKNYGYNKDIRRV